MVSRNVTVSNMTGFHLRPAGVLCKIAMNFQSSVHFRYRTSLANAKSVLSVLGAGVRQGDEIEIICEGMDEADALEAIVKGIEDGLGE